MSPNVSILRPGLLLSVHTRMNGGVFYEKKVLSVDEERLELETGVDIQKWETTKTIANKAEFERALDIRRKAVYAIQKHCIKSAFGLICPETRENELDSAITVAKNMFLEFNQSSSFSTLELRTLKGRIAASEEQAVKAIGAEVRGLLDDMNRAITKMDPDALKESIDRTQEMAEMLAEEQQSKIGLAIEQARIAKRSITKELKTLKKQGLSSVGVIRNFQKEQEAIAQAKAAILIFDEEPVQLSPKQEAPAIAVKDLGLEEEAEVQTIDNGIWPEMSDAVVGDEATGMTLQ